MTVAVVGVFHSPVEFRSYSMDRYALKLRAALGATSPETMSFVEYRPPAMRVRVPGRLGRYWSRYVRYWTYAHKTSFDVNHVLDHSYGHLTYTLDGHRSIVTCHDLFPLRHRHGQISGLKRRRTPPLTFALSISGLRGARFVVADSEATRKQLVEIRDLPADRIRVIPPGTDVASPVSNPKPISRREVRILCVSTGAPYKNHRGVVEVLARVVKRHDRRVVLIRVGPALPRAEHELLRRYGLRGNVVELGHVSEEALGALYRSSDILLHPSFYEGFGLPPLEAMASGLPVVTSTAEALVELTRDAALQADALDYDGLADCVLQILEDESVMCTLSQRGLRRAKPFTWEASARRFAELYDAILQESGLRR